MEYIHPSDLTPEQRRANNASVFARFARAHERVAERSPETAEHHKAMASSARKVERKILAK